jgi:hypothetical protein
MASRLLLASLLALALVACEAATDECPIPTVRNPTGAEPGQACAADTDCLYNICWQGVCRATDFVNKNGKPSGAECTADADCGYGWCYKGSSITGGDPNVGFCSRNCSCDYGGTGCSDDGYFLDESDRPTTEPLFYCQRPSTSSGGTDTVKAFCVPRCETVADCAEYSDIYKVCRAPDTGTPKKLCHVE